MSERYGLETTFNTVAEKYDRMRPGYVSELYGDVFRYAKIGLESRALEIGIGTGQATKPVLDAGCRLTAVELGDELAAFAARKFRGYPNFAVVNEDFLDFEAPENTFDLIYSASAFHWIPEKEGYEKVFRMLRPGGAFARFANHPFKDLRKPGLHDAMQRWYGQYMPGNLPKPSEYGEEEAEERAEIAAKYGFVDIECYLYRRTRTFTAQEYTQLLGTYSDHIALGEAVMNEFFARIREEIGRFGGEITIYDTIDLQLARKPG